MPCVSASVNIVREPALTGGESTSAEGASCSRIDCIEKGVRLAQKIQVGQCIPVGIQIYTAEVGPTSGPTWRLSHLRQAVVGLVAAGDYRKAAGVT